MPCRRRTCRIASGELGGSPSVKGTGAERHHHRPLAPAHAEQFGAILLKVNPDGSQVRLRDVARVGLGARTIDLH
jgi:multidrug efflux pump